MSDQKVKVIDKTFKGSPETPEVVDMVPTQDHSMAAIVHSAIAGGADKEYLDSLERLFALHVEAEEREAKKAFVKAVAAFKANPPKILKTAHVSYVNNKQETVEWDHAVLGEITEAIIAGMSPHGLYHRWTYEKKEGDIFTTCILTHEDGHSEEITMDGPPDTSGNKDALKAAASTNTILQRLTLLAVTGLAAKGMDKESVPDTIEYVTPEQASEITDLINASDTSEKIVLAYYKIDNIAELPASEYKAAVKKLSASASKPKVEPGSDG